MKRAIVLGANGQLGKTIKDFSSTGTIEFDFFSRNELDITNKNSLKNAFENKDFHYCINCAAFTNVEGAETNIKEAFLINAEGVKNIAEICRLNEIKLIHISTDYVFNGEKRTPYDVKDSTDPINEYGKSKLQGESYIQEQLKEHYIIRTSWLYSLHGKNFLKTIIEKIKNEVILNITTEEEGTPTSCIDLAKFILFIMKEDTLPYGIYNFSAKGSTTWFGFAQEIVLNYNPKQLNSILPSEKFKTLAKRPKYSVLDVRKTEKNYITLEFWEGSVKAMVKAYKNQRSSV